MTPVVIHTSVVRVRTSEAAWLMGTTPKEVIRLADAGVLPVHGRDERGRRLFAPEDLIAHRKRTRDELQADVQLIVRSLPDRTYTEIAAMLGVNRFTLRKWLNGVERPQVRYLAAISGLIASIEPLPETSA